MDDAYTPEFFQLYWDYLQEPRVRSAHDRVLRLVSSARAFDRTLDLGCGTGEFFDHFPVQVQDYLGIDVLLNPFFRPRGAKKHRLLDYRALSDDELRDLLKNRQSFVSLFSSEITATWRDNYALYSRVFSLCPQVTHALVSGFYYETCRDAGFERIRETGGVVSFQTLETSAKVLPYLPDDVTETRIEMHVPSKMFADDVFEVWKLLVRDCG